MARTIVIIAHCADSTDGFDEAEDALMSACAQFEDIAEIHLALTAPGRYSGLDMADFMTQAAIENINLVRMRHQLVRDQKEGW